MPAFVPNPSKAMRNTRVFMPSGKGCAGCRKASKENDPTLWKKIKNATTMNAVPICVMIK